MLIAFGQVASLISTEVVGDFIDDFLKNNYAMRI